MMDDFLHRMKTTLIQWEVDEPKDDWWQYQRDHEEAADRIEALKAELRVAKTQLAKISLRNGMASDHIACHDCYDTSELARQTLANMESDDGTA